MVAPLKIDTWRDLEQHRARVDQHKENQARLAVSYASYVTHGWGEVEPANCFDFNCIFVDKPFVTDGTDLDQSTPAVSGHFPESKVSVSRWRRDASGNYTGAWLLFKISTLNYQMWGTNYPGSSPNYMIHHHIRFEGVALKALPAWILDIGG